MLFSERNGYKKVEDIILRENMTIELRNKLWNAIQMIYFIPELSHEVANFYNRYWHKHLKKTFDDMPMSIHEKEIF